MRRYRIGDLNAKGTEHVASHLLKGEALTRGGLSFTKPGHRTHDGHEHRHDDDEEMFIILQGKGLVQIDGRQEPISAGDVLIIEPGEEHHLVSDEQDPLVHIWLHAGERQTESRD
ncbi:MAG: cupin domain-containing protein [Firmicutes bacterium]|jgi:quercetin dioxygenase-like cupin family protein|nr:cupin domain-containing protein [Bacillota bacterium]